jgi:hypothetical protein
MMFIMLRSSVESTIDVKFGFIVKHRNNLALLHSHRHAFRHCGSSS